MYFLSDVNFSKRDKQKNKPNYLVGAAQVGGVGLVGQQTLRSGIPRALGVRLESHSTSRKTAKNILNNGGYLDPNYGGTGASKINDDFLNSSQKEVHITGYHKDYAKGAVTKKVIPNGYSESVLQKSNNPISNVIHRKAQRSMYRGLAGEDLAKGTTKDKILKMATGIIPGALGLKGKTLYVGGTDEYFNKNFHPDMDDYALKSTNKVKVFGSRLGAVRETIQREGLDNLMKANKGRVAAGLGILGGGVAATGYLANQARKNLTGNYNVKSYKRKNKSGKIVLVKGFTKQKNK